MKYYKLRIDFVARHEEIMQYISEKCRKWAYVREKGSADDNPHFHFYIETDVKNPTLRSAFRKYGLIGNGSYSLVETEEFPLEYLAYMCKEGKVSYHGFGEDEIKQISEYDEKVKKEIKEMKEKKRRLSLDYLKDSMRRFTWIFVSILSGIILKEAC